MGSVGSFFGFGSSKKGYAQAPTSKLAFPQLAARAPRIAQNIEDFAGNLPGIPSEEGLYQTEQRRLLEGLRPGYAARGWLTSGNAQKAEEQAIKELGQEFTSRGFERGLQRSGLQLSSLLDLMRSITQQKLLGETPVQTSGTTYQGGITANKFLG